MDTNGVREGRYQPRHKRVPRGTTKQEMNKQRSWRDTIAPHIWETAVETQNEIPNLGNWMGMGENKLFQNFS